jgi:hypothetical protein
MAMDTLDDTRAGHAGKGDEATEELLGRRGDAETGDEAGEGDGEGDRGESCRNIG